MNPARLSFSRQLVVFAALSLASGVVAGCGSESGTSSGSSSGGQDGSTPERTRLKEPLRPAASCPVVIETPELLASPHVPEGSSIQYNSNPPSSGPHYPVWANFEEFEAPVDWGYLVHSMEHGAVLLLHKCQLTEAGCTEVVAGLRRIRDAVATDPKCDPAIRVRVVIAPSPTLEGPIAAAAWGWTYKADCVDEPTLTDFARSHYAQGTEDFCTPGRSF